MIPTTEEWRPVVGWEGVYSISNPGRVRRDRGGQGSIAGRILSPITNSTGRFQITLYANGRREMPLVHRLVARAFIGPCPDGHQGNHIDGSPQHNAATNLEYITRTENMRHAFHTGLNPTGANRSIAKLTPDQVSEIRRLREFGKAALARRFGVSPGCIQGILSGRNWKGIPA